MTKPKEKDPLFEILNAHSGLTEVAALFDRIPNDLNNQTYYYKAGQVDAFINDMNEHFQLEEDLIFGPIEKSHDAPEELLATIHRLRLEHEELKQLGARVMEGLLTEIMPVNEENRKALIMLFKSYTGHLLVHANYEDKSLFPQLARIGLKAVT